MHHFRQQRRLRRPVLAALWRKLRSLIPFQDSTDRNQNGDFLQFQKE